MRFRFVDGLRGFAAAWVMLFHLHDRGEVGASFVGWWPMLARWFAHLGYMGVDVFFVISGFVMAYALRNDRVSAPFAGRFVLRRSLRLDPPYWAVIAILILEGLWWRWWSGPEHGGLPSLGRLLAHLTYMQTVLGYDQMLAVFWTLCREFQFYLVFVAILWAARSPHLMESPRRGLLLVFGAATALSLAWPTGIFEDNPWPGLFFPQWYMFLMGAWTWWVVAGKAPVWCLWSLWGVLAACALPAQDAHIALAVATSVSLWIAARDSARMGGWLGGVAWQYSGKISYSLYLIHPIIGSWACGVGERLGVQGAAWSATLWMVGVFGLCFAAAHLLWWGVERPSMRWAQRLRAADRPTKPASIPPREPSVSSV